MVSSSEQGFAIPGYDPAQLRLLEGYDLSGLGQGAAYSAAAPERTEVQVFVGEREIQLSAEGVSRVVRWAGNRGRKLQPRDRELADVRRAGTLALLSSPGREFFTSDIQRLITSVGVMPKDHQQTAAALREWWGRVRLGSKLLIVASAVGGKWCAYTNPELDLQIAGIERPDIIDA